MFDDEQNIKINVLFYDYLFSSFINLTEYLL